GPRALWNEPPLHAGRESGAATAPQTRVLDGRDDLVGLQAQRLGQGSVPVVAQIGVHRPGLRLIPVPGEDRSEGHRSLPPSIPLGSGWCTGCSGTAVLRAIRSPARV